MENKLVGLIGSCFVVLNICAIRTLTAAQEPNNDDMMVSISAAQYGKMPLLISTVGAKAADIQMLVDLVRRDLTWSGQFDVSIEHLETIPTKQQLLAAADRGFPLMVFVSRDDDGKGFAWRLYDTTQPVMVKGKRLTKRSIDARVWAHEMSDMLWPVLTGQDGFFSTKIAYCKEVKRDKKRPFKHLCVADYDGSNEVVRVPTMTVAPRWGSAGLLFFSECTNANIRLVYIDEQGMHHVASNFDGLNMQPSFSRDGSISVYCASRGRGSCQIYYCAPGVFKQLTHNNGNNVSPTLTADGKKVYFCSDYKTGKPAIYCIDIQSGAIKELIGSGLCPSFSERLNKLVYIKNVKGVMQLFIYDIGIGRSEQITFDAGDKDECSWSACGNYVAYSVSRGYSSRVAALNLISHEVHWITKEHEVCTYPSLSPVYGATMTNPSALSL